MDNPNFHSRRNFMFRVAVGVFACGASENTLLRKVYADNLQSDGEMIEEWMKSASLRAPVGALNVSRFVERIWFLTEPIGWKPDNPDQVDYKPITVPAGFVTDFASIPRIFWSLLPPDGKYVYPAIIHDYMYWVQDRSKSEADEILKIGMEEFDVSWIDRIAIYNAVKKFGGKAWEENARLRRGGEKRVLSKFPQDPRESWFEWKKNRDYFI